MSLKALSCFVSNNKLQETTFYMYQLHVCMLAVSVSRMTPKVTLNFHPRSVGKQLSVYGGSALCVSTCCSCAQSIYGFKFFPMLFRATHTNYNFSFFIVFLILWIFNYLFFHYYVFFVWNCMLQFCNLMCTFVLSGNLLCLLGRWYSNLYNILQLYLHLRFCTKHLVRTDALVRTEHEDKQSSQSTVE